MYIQIINDMQNGMEQLQQHKVKLSEYWRLASAAATAAAGSSDPKAGGDSQQPPLPPDLDKVTWHGKAPLLPEDVKSITTVEEQNLPGWDATFDDVNLHLHGMQVVPHLFYVSPFKLNECADLGLR
jgi:hypothetical protein